MNIDIKQGISKNAQEATQAGSKRVINTLFVDFYLNQRAQYRAMPATGAAVVTFEEADRLMAKFAPQYDGSERQEMLETAADRGFDCIVITNVYDHKNKQHKAFLSRIEGLLDTKDRLDAFYSQIPAATLLYAMNEGGRKWLQPKLNKMQMA